jgi:ATP-dependent Clp protease adaptor protein ClpS
MAESKELIRTEKKSKVKEPAMFQVILLNDHYTSMEFVILILERVFHKSHSEATTIMLSVHQTGAGIAGVYTKEVAETKIQMVDKFSASEGYPLRCTLEPVR